MKIEKTLNIAYGSNLSLKQMSYRCPTAKVYGKGMLEGYRLLFKGMEGNAYATIETCEGCKVPVLIWDLKPKDEKELDRYEGFPTTYKKEWLEVNLDNGETVTAMVYIMNDKLKSRRHINLPSRMYLNIVIEGYIDADFDIKYLESALEISREKVYKNIKD